MTATPDRHPRHDPNRSPPPDPPPGPDPDPHPSQGAIRACAKGGAHDMVQLLWGRLRNATVYGEQPRIQIDSCTERAIIASGM